MRAVPATWEKSWNPARRRCTSPASLSWAPSHVTGTPIVTLRDNSEQARQGVVAAGCAVVSVLAGQVDIAEIDGMFLPSPAPGQQVREGDRAVTAPRGGHRAGPALCAVNPVWAGGWIREGPGHPVDNGGRSRCRRDALRSEGIPRPSSHFWSWRAAPLSGAGGAPGAANWPPGRRTGR
jgi:hypothetical protein